MPPTTPLLRGPYVRVRLGQLDARARTLGLATDAEIADRIGISPAVVSRIRSGDALPGERFIAAAVSKLGVSFEYLFEIAEAS